MNLNESDTRAKLIEPALHKKGWTEDFIRREETAGTVEIINGKARRRDSYAFKCTAASSGNDQLPDLRAATRSHFIATTVDLLSTGVDVPCVRNIVFFKYLKSPISFYQMVGRGTRIDAPTNKPMFRVYDYTDASRLFGEGFIPK
ncbi:MAG: helicase-related protein, partial [Kiritimatiellae bacterium]|nr:helicase-related protein [Kiritimatiellia bacterium]